MCEVFYSVTEALLCLKKVRSLPQRAYNQNLNSSGRQQKDGRVRLGAVIINQGFPDVAT